MKKQRIKKRKKKEKLGYHLTDFFYEHMENIRKEYERFIEICEDSEFIGAAEDDLDILEEDLEDIIEYEKTHNINYKGRRELVRYYEGELFETYDLWGWCDAKKEVGWLLREVNPTYLKTEDL